jgi:4-hydroxy-3-polyprenylbenzoate decarboxylase/2,5-furandicarboxylate decarboxylase 1
MDFRNFLMVLEQSGELVRIKEPIKIEYEVGALCRQLSDSTGPAVLLENIGDTGIPLAANIFGTRARLARGLGVSEAELLQHVAERLKSRVSVTPCKNGAARCQEIVITGDEVDVTKIPFPLWNLGDGGRYITAGLVIARHPEFGWNVAYHRCQLFGQRELGIATASDHQLALTVEEGAARGERVEAAIVVGVRPSIALAAGSDFPLGDFELEVAGALEGQAIEVARCRTVDVIVPEDTEIVLEGYFDGERRDEGPFVEFTGWQTPIRNNPVFKITAITHRRSPVCHGVYAGKPPCETNIIWRELEESEAFDTLRRRFPQLVGVHRPPELGRDFVAVLMVNPERVRAGLVRNLLLATTAVMPRLKYVIAVDNDVDIYNFNDVMWAVATRCDPKVDIAIVEGTMTTNLDPSSGGFTGKVFFDATKKPDFRGNLPSYPSEAVSRARELLAAALAAQRSATLN